MSKQHDTKHEPASEQRSRSTPRKEKREPGKENNAPGKTVGTKTPGLKKNEDVPIARERKARRDGTEEESD